MTATERAHYDREERRLALQAAYAAGVIHAICTLCSLLGLAGWLALWLGR